MLYERHIAVEVTAPEWLAANSVVLELIFGFGGHKEVGIGMNQDLVVDLVISKRRFDQFT